MNPILAALVKPDDQPIRGSYQGWLSQVRFPLIATPKVDGIRCHYYENAPWSRSNKPIVNQFVAQQLRSLGEKWNGVDGELVTYDDDDKVDSFNDVQSKIMSMGGAPEFKFLAFDICNEGQEFIPYEFRYTALSESFKAQTDNPPWLSVLPAKLLTSLDELLEYQDQCIAEGWEGWCARRPNSIYKQGRATFQQHYLLKGKLFEDADAQVVGWRELHHNDNPAFLNELGYLRRPSHQANQRPGGMLGAFLCRALDSNKEFWLGGGFTQKQRIDFWLNKESLLNHILTYRHQPYGAKDKPRILTFVGFRYDL